MSSALLASIDATVKTEKPEEEVNKFLMYLSEFQASHKKTIASYKKAVSSFKNQAPTAERPHTFDSYRKTNTAFRYLRHHGQRFAAGLDSLRRLIVVQGKDVEFSAFHAELNAWTNGIMVLGAADQGVSTTIAMVPQSAQGTWKRNRSVVANDGTCEDMMNEDISACLKVVFGLEALVLAGLKVLTFASKNAKWVIADVAVTADEDELEVLVAKEEVAKKKEAEANHAKKEEEAKKKQAEANKKKKEKEDADAKKAANAAAGNQPSKKQSKAEKKQADIDSFGEGMF